MIFITGSAPSGQAPEPMHPGSIPHIAIALGRQLSTNSLRDQCLNRAVDFHRTGAVGKAGSQGKIKRVLCHTVSRSNRSRIHWVFARCMHGGDAAGRSARVCRPRRFYLEPCKTDLVRRGDYDFDRGTRLSRARIGNF